MLLVIPVVNKFFILTKIKLKPWKIYWINTYLNTFLIIIPVRNQLFIL